MIVTFAHEYLEDLYYEGVSKDKKHRFQPWIIKGYKKCIEALLEAENIEALYQRHALNYEVLEGDKQGISSVRANDQYRVEFTVNKKDGESRVTICHIIELSNHYK